VTSGRTRLLPTDGPLGVISAPRNSRGLPESRSRESRPTTRRPREPHRRNGGWRHPPPSGSPSGPVGPSGRNSNPDFPVQPRRPLGAKRNLEGSRGRVKAMFPLARRVYPAQDGRTTAMEFPVMSRASGKRVRVSTGSLHRHRSHGAHVRGLVPGAPLQAASRLRPQGAAQPAPTRTPVPGRAFPAYEPCHRSWNRTLVPSSGEDLRPWWPTARYLPRSTRTSSRPQNSQWPRRPLGSPGSRGVA
jgi:hypothetical protein